MLNLTTPELAFVLSRLLLGGNLLTHFLVRLPKLGGAKAGFSKQFAATPLPAPLEELVAPVLPFAEGAIGGLLLLGLFTRPALAAAMLLMKSLIIGSRLLKQ